MLFNLNQSNPINPTEDVRGAKVTSAVTATTTVGVLLAANPLRAAISIFNAGSVDIFIREGATVTSTLYELKIPPGYLYKEEYAGGRYLGAISVITASGSAVLMVSEGSVI